jgi:hypothetical protein
MPTTRRRTPRTYRTLLTQVLTEVTGRDPATVASLVDAIVAQQPSATIDTPLEDQEYESRLAGLRKEKAGILNRLLEGQGRPAPDERALHPR